MKKPTALLAFMLFTACAPQPSISEADQLATVVAGTLTAQPPATFTPIPAFTPTRGIAPIPTAVFGATSAENVNLRTLPGMLFPVSRVMAEGTKLQIMGLAPGDEWAYVVNEEGIAGWVDIRFIDQISAPVLERIVPPDLQVIRGTVHDANGAEINGIVFALTQGSLRADAMTDVNGVFYAYLPFDASGTWTVSFLAIHVSSKAMDNACLIDHVCGTTDPVSMEIVLPDDDMVQFSWE